MDIPIGSGLWSGYDVPEGERSRRNPKEEAADEDAEAEAEEDAEAEAEEDESKAATEDVGRSNEAVKSSTSSSSSSVPAVSPVSPVLNPATVDLSLEESD